MISEKDKKLLEDKCRDISKEYNLAQAYFTRSLGLRRHFLAGFGKACFEKPRTIAFDSGIMFFGFGDIAAKDIEKIKTELAGIVHTMEERI
jgi:hypothetical protein